MSGLPEDFLNRLNDLFDDTTRAVVLESFTSPKDVTFRVNTLLGDQQEVIRELAESMQVDQIHWMGNAFRVDTDNRKLLLQSNAFASGQIYIQNASSMVPVNELNPQPGENVLDLTAAPGSKTTQIAALMNNDGYVAAVESVRNRYFKLRANLERHGVTCVRTIHKDGMKVWRYRPEYFDRVLLDSPCSSEGRFRVGEPETTQYWSERKIAEMHRKQFRLLQSAIRCVKVGGTVVYSTCSFAPEENELIVTRIKKRSGSFIEEIPLSIQCPNYTNPMTEWRDKTLTCKEGRRIVPDRLMDGFFVAKFIKTAPNPQ